MDTLEYGFRIVCLDCGRVLELKEYNLKEYNKDVRMKSITIVPSNEIGIVEIECQCGNQIRIGGL